MAGGPASETIMFVAAVLAAGLVAGSLSTVAGELSQGLDQRGDAMRAELTGHFIIANDPTDVPTGPLIIYLKNTGSTTFATSQIALIVDGVAASSMTFEVDGVAADTFGPGELLSIETTDFDPLAAGAHRALVIAGNGHKEALDFTV